jgi:hypothetical protein
MADRNKYVPIYDQNGRLLDNTAGQKGCYKVKQGQENTAITWNADVETENGWPTDEAIRKATERMNPHATN